MSTAHTAIKHVASPLARQTLQDTSLTRPVAGIQPIRLDDEAEIEPILKQISTAIREGGLPWVDKALKKGSDGARFDQMAAEGWDE